MKRKNIIFLNHIMFPSFGLAPLFGAGHDTCFSQLKLFAVYFQYKLFTE